MRRDDDPGPRPPPRRARRPRGASSDRAGRRGWRRRTSTPTARAMLLRVSCSSRSKAASRTPARATAPRARVSPHTRQRLRPGRHHPELAVAGEQPQQHADGEAPPGGRGRSARASTRCSRTSTADGRQVGGPVAPTDREGEPDEGDPGEDAEHPGHVVGVERQQLLDAARRRSNRAGMKAPMMSITPATIISVAVMVRVRRRWRQRCRGELRRGARSDRRGGRRRPTGPWASRCGAWRRRPRAGELLGTGISPTNSSTSRSSRPTISTREHRSTPRYGRGRPRWAGTGPTDSTPQPLLA